MRILDKVIFSRIENCLARTVFHKYINLLERIKIPLWKKLDIQKNQFSHLWTSTKFRSLPSAADSILRWKAVRSRKLRRKKMKGSNNRSWPGCETTIPNQINILSQGFAGETSLLLSSIFGRRKIHFEQYFTAKTFINDLSQLTILLCIF